MEPAAGLSDVVSRPWQTNAMAALETPRLRLRPLNRSDLDALHALFVAPGVRRFLWDDEVIPRDRTREVIATSVHTFARSGHGLWRVATREDDGLVGVCGYYRFYEPPRLELVCAMAPTTWGRGLASEAARAVVEYGFVALGFEQVRASTDAPNAASLRAMRRLGFRPENAPQGAHPETMFLVLDRAGLAAATSVGAQSASRRHDAAPCGRKPHRL